MPGHSNFSSKQGKNVMHAGIVGKISFLFFFLGGWVNVASQHLGFPCQKQVSQLWLLPNGQGKISIITEITLGTNNEFINHY